MVKKIEEIANNLITSYQTLPIDINKIVVDRGIKLMSHDLGDNISGVLIIENGVATIGYNKNEAKVRNRFTIAHELGHFELHKDKDLFVDKGFKIMYRSTAVDEKAQKYEREANEFAAYILMPEKLIRKEIANLNLDYTDDAAIKKLANKFDVSSIAMSIRLSNLL